MIAHVKEGLLNPLSNLGFSFGIMGFGKVADRQRGVRCKAARSGKGSQGFRLYAKSRILLKLANGILLRNLPDMIGKSFNLGSGDILMKFLDTTGERGRSS